jgi:hypothetical protein
MKKQCSILGYCFFYTHQREAAGSHNVTALRKSVLLYFPSTQQLSTYFILILMFKTKILGQADFEVLKCQN